MSSVQLQKQMVRNFEEALRDDGENITIKYYTKKAGVTNENWSMSEGTLGQYTNTASLRKIITGLKFNDNNVANAILNKNNWFVRYSDCDFSNRTKRFITIVDGNGYIYSIDKVIPIQKIGDSYLCWMLMQG